MDHALKDTLIGWAEEYNDPKYFQEDPIIFPTRFARKYKEREAALADVEISALLAAHLAWGRRAMIVRDCGRMFDEMDWRPYDYVMTGDFRDENASLHRTIKWCDFAAICRRLKDIYSTRDSIEGMTDTQIRCMIFGQKEDRKAPNKKISMMRRWMTRDDGKVDLGVWKARGSSPDLLFDRFVATVRVPRGGKELFLKYLSEAEACFSDLSLSFSVDDWQDFLGKYRAAGMPAVHHSEAYRNSEKPAYRIVLRALIE